MRRALSGRDGRVRRTMPGSWRNSQHRTRRRKRSTSLCFLRHSSSTYCGRRGGDPGCVVHGQPPGPPRTPRRAPRRPLHTGVARPPPGGLGAPGPQNPPCRHPLWLVQRRKEAGGDGAAGFPARQPADLTAAAGSRPTGSPTPSKDFRWSPDRYEEGGGAGKGPARRRRARSCSESRGWRAGGAWGGGAAPGRPRPAPAAAAAAAP
jgi:hypothetical protein